MSIIDELKIRLKGKGKSDDFNEDGRRRYEMHTSNEHENSSRKLDRIMDDIAGKSMDHFLFRLGFRILKGTLIAGVIIAIVFGCLIRIM